MPFQDEAAGIQDVYAILDLVFDAQSSFLLGYYQLSAKIPKTVGVANHHEARRGGEGGGGTTGVAYPKTPAG